MSWSCQAMNQEKAEWTRWEKISHVENKRSNSRHALHDEVGFYGLSHMSPLYINSIYKKTQWLWFCIVRGSSLDREFCTCPKDIDCRVLFPRSSFSILDFGSFNRSSSQLWVHVYKRGTNIIYKVGPKGLYSYIQAGTLAMSESQHYNSTWYCSTVQG